MQHYLTCLFHLVNSLGAFAIFIFFFKELAIYTNKSSGEWGPAWWPIWCPYHRTRRWSRSVCSATLSFLQTCESWLGKSSLLGGLCGLLSGKNPWSEISRGIWSTPTAPKWPQRPGAGRLGQDWLCQPRGCGKAGDTCLRKGFVQRRVSAGKGKSCDSCATNPEAEEQNANLAPAANHTNETLCKNQGKDYPPTDSFARAE